MPVHASSVSALRPCFPPQSVGKRDHSHLTLQVMIHLDQTCCYRTLIQSSQFYTVLLLILVQVILLIQLV